MYFYRMPSKGLDGVILLFASSSSLSDSPLSLLIHSRSGLWKSKELHVQESLVKTHLNKAACDGPLNFINTISQSDQE